MRLRRFEFPVDVIAPILLGAAILLALLPRAHADEAASQPLRLRTPAVCEGPAITFGCLFENSGDKADLALALAPKHGQAMALSPDFLSRAAASQGLRYDPPKGLSAVEVWGKGVKGAPKAPAPELRAPAIAGKPAEKPPADGVKRGETILLKFSKPGMTLTMQARALSDAGKGQTFKALNLQSNKTVEAVAEGPGLAVLVSP